MTLQDNRAALLRSARRGGRGGAARRRAARRAAEQARRRQRDQPDEGGRNLSKSVRRQSHIELHWGEYARARDLLKAASDPAHGDLEA